MRFSIRFFATQLLPQTSCLCLVFVYLFCLPVQISVLFGNPKQISDWAACEWSLYSHSVMKANTSPGSSASFVPVALSHEFNPAISIDFHSFNLETPIKAPQSTIFNEISPNIRKKKIDSLPFPPVACSIFRWSTVICSISAFSNLADPFEIRNTYK